jgi:hypothetical protein
MKKVKYFDCQCGCQILRIEPVPEYRGFFVAIFEMAGDKMDMGNRVRHCFNALIHGKPYGDQVILDKEQAKELSEFINKNIKDKKCHIQKK